MNIEKGAAPQTVLMDALFSLEGRLKRRAFLGYAVILVFGLWVLAFIPFMLLPRDGVGGNVSMVFGGIAGIAYFWGFICLSGKRLHDIGWSAKHLIWIYLLGGVGPGVAVLDEGLGLVGSLANLGVWLWILLTPSSPSERFGPRT